MQKYGREDAISMLLAAVKDSGRTSQDVGLEIRNAVDGAIAYLEEHPGDSNGRGSWQAPDPTNYHFQDPGWHQDSRSEYLPTNAVLRKEMLANRDTIEISAYPEFSYTDLFANINFLLCCCVNVNMPEIKPLCRWMSAGMHTQQFIVPNYCLHERLGKCDLNMGKSLYQVIEFDGDSKVDQAKLLFGLEEEFELALGMIVDSGNKSLHGWFPIFHLDRREWRSFVRLATSLGADPMLRIPSQYVRMPGGVNRKTNNRQRVLYYNKEVIHEHNLLVRKECL
jgi:hypothetical protein